MSDVQNISWFVKLMELFLWSFVGDLPKETFIPTAGRGRVSQALSSAAAWVHTLSMTTSKVLVEVNTRVELSVVTEVKPRESFSSDCSLPC